MLCLYNEISNILVASTHIFKIHTALRAENYKRPGLYKAQTKFIGRYFRKELRIKFLCDFKIEVPCFRVPFDIKVWQGKFCGGK